MKTFLVVLLSFGTIGTLYYLSQKKGLSEADELISKGWYEDDNGVWHSPSTATVYNNQ